MMFLSYMITIVLFKSVNKHCKNIDYPYFISVQYFLFPHICQSQCYVVIKSSTLMHSTFQ